MKMIDFLLLQEKTNLESCVYLEGQAIILFIYQDLLFTCPICLGILPNNQALRHITTQIEAVHSPEICALLFANNN